MKSDKLFPAISFLLSFAFYLATVANTVSFFDSGELLSAAATLGISHPPGYPLYAQWEHIYSYIPLGNIAFRINMASSVFGSLAVMIMYLITHYLILKVFPQTKDDIKVKLTALSASLAFAFSLNHWGQTNMAEVYAMNTFFTALIIIVLLINSGLKLVVPWIPFEPKALLFIQRRIKIRQPQPHFINTINDRRSNYNIRYCRLSPQGRQYIIELGSPFTRRAVLCDLIPLPDQ